ncbi:16S rRNA (cytosine(1402)-N(4))-methyltransferase RsmH [bacterium]|nr:16S rRNA (cytosine(1402)-N(4))-methyltransferase RsmH [bacterium]
MTSFSHQPVLLYQAVELLVHDPAGIYIDATIGGGGHAQEILKYLTTGHLIGLDRDPDAIDYCREKFGESIRLIQTQFSKIQRELSPIAPTGVQGVLFDFGVSSYQIENPARGFSFQQDGPLDLRMNPTSGQSAADLIRSLSMQELRRLLRTYGEEPQATRIAKAIIQARQQAPIQTTAQLASVISKSVPAAGVKALARVFQALRIAVNDELEELERGLENAWASLAGGGRLVALSYHSLEDRRVKTFFASKSRTCTCPPEQPICTCGGQAQAISLTKRVVRPTFEEIAKNPRARSARLRAIQKR